MTIGSEEIDFTPMREPAVTPVTVRLVVLVWIFAVAMAATGHAMQGNDPFNFFLLNYIPPMLTSIGWSLGLISLLGWSRRLALPWRLLLMAAAVMAVSVIQTMMDMVYNRMLALTVAPVWREWAVELTSARFAFAMILYAWTFAFSVLLIWAMRANDSARMNAARAAAFEAATLKAEANALRLQLNPHFLFNTLNGIASLTVSGRKRQAEEMINLLADFLRSSIASDPTAETALKDEAATVVAYLRIEAARFGDRMQVETDIPAALSRALAPNFILQPLAENAVKYGVAPSRRPVTIRVAASARDGVLLLTVENRISGERDRAANSRAAPSEAQDRHGIGLSNTRQRLALAYGDTAWLTVLPLDDGYRAEIGLPLRLAPDEGGRARRRSAS